MARGRGRRFSPPLCSAGLMPRAIRSCPNRRSGLWSDLIGHAMACRSPLACLASLWSSYVTFESRRATAASSTYWRIESWQLYLKQLTRRGFIGTGCRGGARCRSMQFFKANNAMDLNQAIIGRRAVRGYTKEAIDERTIRGLVDAAVHAPSAVNQQPWAFTVVRDQSLLD